jgi:hypothetical protein
MPHPDEGLIHAWLDGELDPAEAARVEALVESDAEWAAAAAEARGLIAASSRIAATLDRVPANVIPGAPRAKPAVQPASRQWVWRAAAVLAVMVGSAVVLKREAPVLPGPNRVVAALPAKPAPSVPPQSDSLTGATVSAKAKQEPAPLAKGAAEQSAGEAKKEIADLKRAEPALAQQARDKDAAAGAPRANAGASVGALDRAAGAGAERRALNAPMAATAQSAAPAAPSAKVIATEKFTRLQPSCFEQREPADSAARVIRLTAAALADSVRLETLVLRGDTLAAVNGRLRAIRVPCPAP